MTIKLARIRGDLSADFAIGNVDEGWVSYSALGIDARTTAEAIAQFDAAAHGAGDQDAVPTPTLDAPIVGVGKILAIGLNYNDHIQETNSTPPERPVVFAKYTSSVTGPFDPIVMDAQLTGRGDYESELAVVIGTECRKVSEADALDYVFGYTVANDVSARDWQKADSQFSRSKGFDSFCPIGPWVTPASEIDDPNDLWIRSSVNGERRQDSTTAHMLFQVPFLISYLSQTMTLHPGDVILTGTPDGVGFAMEPPRYLVPGDIVICEVQGLGGIENNVIGPQ